MLRRIAVLFPAYKEDRVTFASVESFLEQDYPKDLFDLSVISDQMRPETNEALQTLPIRLLTANYTESSKAKAMALAMESSIGTRHSGYHGRQHDNVRSLSSHHQPAFDSGVKSNTGTPDR